MCSTLLTYVVLRWYIIGVIDHCFSFSFGKQKYNFMNMYPNSLTKYMFIFYSTPTKVTSQFTAEARER